MGINPEDATGYVISITTTMDKVSAAIEKLAEAYSVRTEFLRQMTGGGVSIPLNVTETEKDEQTEG